MDSGFVLRLQKCIRAMKEIIDGRNVKEHHRRRMGEPGNYIYRDISR